MLIRLTALGDVVLVEPVARALRQRFEGVEIVLVTEARYAALCREGGAYDRVVGWDRRGEDSGWSGITRVLGRLDGRYDCVIDLQGKLRTRILAWRLRANARRTLRKRTPLQALAALLGHDPPLADRHAVDVYMGALSGLGVRLQGSSAPRLALPRGPHREAGRRVGLCAGTTHATKRWPAERFARLADEICQRDPDAEVVLIGGPTDRETLDAIRSEVRQARLQPVNTEGLDVAALAAFIATLDVFIGVDSGPAHLAAASGVPVIALFGPTSSVRWGPRGDRHQVVSLGLDCAPCSNVGGPTCPRADRAHACMQQLPVTAVLEAYDRVPREASSDG